MPTKKSRDYSSQWGPDPVAPDVELYRLPEADSNKQSERNHAESSLNIRSEVNRTNAPSMVDRSSWRYEHRHTKLTMEDDGLTLWRFAWSVFTGRATCAFLLLMSGMLLFALVTRGIEVYSRISALNTWEARCAVGLLGFSVAAVVVAAGYFVSTYFRLRSNRQVHLNELEAFSRRADLRRKKSAEDIKCYLESYPLENAGTLRMDEAIRTNLLAQKRNLLGHWWPRQKQFPDQWISRYLEDFQRRLDDQANACVTNHAGIVALKTAASPNAILDTAIVLFWSFKLLGDLCRLYNLRVGALGTAALLSRVFFLAFIAGKIDEWEEPVESDLESVLKYILPGDVASNVMGRFAAKAGAGLANYLLMKRLGNKAIEMLRPVSP